MNTEYEAHRSDFPGFPEGPFVLMVQVPPLRVKTHAAPTA
jgi:hypothetical protein